MADKFQKLGWLVRKENGLDPAAANHGIDPLSQTKHSSKDNDQFKKTNIGHSIPVAAMKAHLAEAEGLRKLGGPANIAK